MLSFFKNLFPVQIENVLTAHTSIREAAAVSVPDPRYGEVVGAWIVPESGSRLSRADVHKVVSDGLSHQVHLSPSPSFLDIKNIVACPRVGVVYW